MDVMVDGPDLGKNGDLSDLEDGELIDDEPQELVVTLPPEEEKKILRAKRFGIGNSSKPKDPEVFAIQKRMGLGPNARTEALHLYGTDNMKTEDVFQYFFDYPPASIEWLNDKSCNVVWLDEETCAKALIKYSTHIRGQLASMDYDHEEEESLSLADVRMALPPGTWRKGKSTLVAPRLLIRYATTSDKRSNLKPPLQKDWDDRRTFVFPDEGDEVAKSRVRADPSNPWSDIAIQWGHFEHKSAAKKQLSDIRGPIIRDARDNIQKSLGIRDARQLLSKPPSADYQAPIRRKMIADLEEQKQKMRTLGLGNRTVDLRDRISRKRGRLERERREEDEVGTTLSTVMQKLAQEKEFAGSEDEESVIETSGKEEEDEEGSSSTSSTTSSSTSSSSSSSSSSESSSSSDSSSSSSESDSEESVEVKKKIKRSAHGKVCKKYKARLQRASHDKKSRKFNPSPLRIEIDNDIYYNNGGNAT